MNYFALILACVLVVACKKDDPLPNNRTESFIFNYENKGEYLYLNPECEFDNRNSQSQFTWTSTSLSGVPKAYVLFSTYRNSNAQDSTLDQVWITLFVEYDSTNSIFSTDYLEQLLQTENSSINYNHLYPDVQIEVCGERYDNEDIITEPGESVYKINENFSYEINDYEVLYQSTCVGRMLLYIDITFKGMLYKHSFGEIHDSLYVKESQLKLLFDIE